MEVEEPGMPVYSGTCPLHGGGLATAHFLSSKQEAGASVCPPSSGRQLFFLFAPFNNSFIEV